MNISVFGTGYVGLVTGACLANYGHQVVCVDIDERKIAALNAGVIPFFEPGLKELVQEGVQKGRLKFTTDSQEAVRFGEAIFNCVGTPSKPDGSADLSAVFAVAKAVAQHAAAKKVLINKSTVPPGTARQVDQLMRITNPQSQVRVVSNPEFLKEGAAVHDFNHPNKIVVGAQESAAYEVLREVYSGLLRNYTPIIETNWETAELIKYANNGFLATKISFINEIANIADVIGADVKIVAKAIGMDYRIGPKFLSPGVGYGGSCFPKDVRALSALAKTKGYQAKLLEEVDQFNERQKKVLVQKILTTFNQDVAGKTFGVWGLSFKPKTSDMREAPSITIINELLARGANVQAYDPEAIEEAKKVFGGKIVYSSSAQQAATGADAIVLVTEWDEFRNVDLKEVKKVMKSNKLFDGRNIFDSQVVKSLGFSYQGVGSV